MVETVSTMVSIAVQHKEAIRQAISQAREE
jgi:hypothetical protein